MPKERKDAIEALQIALDTEKKGYHFYTVAAKSSKDPKGRKVFEHLAGDEIDHMKAITAAYESLTRQEPWLTYQQALAKYGATPASGLVFPKAAKKGQDDFDDLLALEEALGIEKKAIAFYQAKAVEVEDPTARSFFQSLVEIEQSHEMIVQAEIDSLMGNGIWLGFQEISLEH